MTFSYEAESGDVLKDVSFAIPKGKMTAIVGPSGAGKSTIVALLGRLYDPQSGAVEIDGIDLRDYKMETWRRALSVVSQSIFLVNDTVERNLTYSLNRPASETEMRCAAETAACARFIEGLPEGYQTLLGERGTRLSGGQQQRLAIARAILVDPQLMIMDEATSSLDSITEHAVQTAMATFGRTRTMVVIAHRLATIKRADNIIVMDEGRVIEQGRHDALLAQRGRYWEMIEHQRLDIVDVPEEGLRYSLHNARPGQQHPDRYRARVRFACPAFFSSFTPRRSFVEPFRLAKLLVQEEIEPVFTFAYDHWTVEAFAKNCTDAGIGVYRAPPQAGQENLVRDPPISRPHGAGPLVLRLLRICLRATWSCGHPLRK